MINDNPDEINFNDGCGSLHIEKLSEYVVEHNLDGGVAFDGDGDRGRILVRPSGTETLIGVMIEGEDIEEITNFAKSVALVIESVLN